MTHVFIPADGKRSPVTMRPDDPRPGAVSEVARTLLSIVGPERVAEVESVTTPGLGYLVPEDVAVEYRRRTEPKPAPEPAPEIVPEPAPAPEPKPGDAARRAIAAAAGKKRPAPKKKTGPKE